MIEISILIGSLIISVSVLIYSLWIINKLKTELRSYAKEIVTLKKSANLHGMALNDLADIVSGKMYAAFPLIGQPGKA